MSNKSKRDNSSSSKQSNKEIECCSCHRKLKNERYFQCTKCFSKFQCLQCASAALDERTTSNSDLTKPPHLFFHDYVIAEPPSSPPHPFTRQNWDQHEEVLLLYGVKKLGLGNWNSVSDFVHTKSAIECEIHYTETYINSPFAPFPINYKSISKSIMKRDKEREKQKQKQKDRNHDKDKEKRKNKDIEKDKDYEKKKKSSKSTDNLTIPKNKSTESIKNDISESILHFTIKKESDSSESNSSSSSSHHHHHSHHHDGVDILPELPIPDPPPYDTRPVESLPSVGNIVHLNEKQKKEPTLPAEFSDYMPFRHEFDKEKDFEADGEILVANIEFKQQDNEETIDTFRDKVNRLKNYNKILNERRFRTKVIEDWNIHFTEVALPKKSHGTTNSQLSSLNGNGDSRSDTNLGSYSNLNGYSNYYSKLPPTLDFADFDSKILGGRTVEDRAVDIKLIALGPYLKKEDTTALAHLIHDRITKEYLIKTRNNWQSLGVKTIEEGQLYQNLNEKIKDDKIIPSEINDWNDRIKQFNDKNNKDKNADAELLLQCEKDLIATHHLHYQKYMSMKDLLIREYMTCQKFPRSKMIIMKNELMLPQLEPIYDLCVNCGWIAP